MRVKLDFFGDILDSLGKIISTLKSIKNIPKVKRDGIRETLSGTYLLLNTTLNMILIRLAEIYRIQDETTFIQEVTLIQYDGTWVDSERAFQLCEGLKYGLREWEVLDQSLINLISLKNWKELKLEMEKILAGENELANFISQNFKRLEDIASKDPKNIAKLKQEIQSFLKVLNIERRKLIVLEDDLFKFI